MVERKLRRFLIALMLLGFLLAGLLTPISLVAQLGIKPTLTLSNSLPDSWPTLHHDLARSGFADDSAPHFPRLLWSFTTAGRIESSPVIGNGIVYVGSEDGYAYALNQSTGQLIWRTWVGQLVYSSPAIVGDSLYIGQGSLYRLNAKTGQKMWGTAIGTITTSILAVGGRVYAIAQNASTSLGAKLYSINATNGSIIWAIYVDQTSELGYANNLLYLGANGTTYALNPYNGSTVWSAAPGLEAAPAIVGGVVYGGNMALNATSGQVIWKYNITTPSLPAVAYGLIFLLSQTALVALNQTNGVLAWFWRFKSPNFYSQSLPAVADGLVFVGGGEGDLPDPTVYALNATTGKFVWSFPVGIAANSSPAISNGTLYIGASDGKLYAITGSLPGVQITIILILVPALIAGAVLIVIIRAKKDRTPIPREDNSTSDSHL